VNDAGATDRDAILRYRAEGHNLAKRLPPGAVVEAAAAIGFRDARGSATLSAHARVANVSPDTINEALAGGALVDVISARGTSTLVPPADVAVFTVGTLPSDEQSLRERLKPFLPVLDRSGHTATEALARAKDVARVTLERGAVDIGVLSGALTRALPELSPMCRGRCGVHHIEQILFDLIGESGVWRHEQVDGTRTYVSMDEPHEATRTNAREELVKRYLRCYAPSTPKQFADWCGISVADARARLGAAPTPSIANARPARGVRILPPRDPYLLDRDRATLVPDREAQKRVWRSNPVDGLVVVDGIPVASWRTAKKRTLLTLKLEPLTKLDTTMVDAIAAEATKIAPLRGCATADVEA
jgi:hypothetical protein